MNNGISIYLGLDNTLEENLQLIDTAYHYGIQRIFTSLHIPETNVALLKKELHTVLQYARNYNMEIISDVSPNTLSLLNLTKLNPNELLKWGISTIRLDFGYNSAQIADLSKSPIKIQFNASTITKDFLTELTAHHTDFSHIDALHNFYPREGTGLSTEKLCQQNKLLHDYNIKTAAFVPSYNKARSPLKKGLPTLEIHRYQTASLAMRHLLQLDTDSIFIGDSLPIDQELQELGKLQNDYLILKAKSLTQNKSLKEILSTTIFTSRLDSAENAIRTQESRAIFKNCNMPCEYITNRDIGMITVDNNDSGRYKGELQIITKKQSVDKTVNIIGKLFDSELLLLERLSPNTKFKIKFY